MKKLLLILLSALLLLSGCTTTFQRSANSSKTVRIDPKPVAANDETKEIKLYFPSTAGGLLLELRNITEKSDSIKQILDEFLKGPKSSYELAGVPAGTQLISYELKQDVLYVNFSSEYSKATRDQVRALVTTLTELPNVNGIQILVEGQKQKNLGMTPMKREVLLGTVKYSPDWLKDIQNQVDEGKQLWRTDPLSVMRTEGGIVGFGPNDDFNVVKEGNGFAQVDVSSLGKGYIISLRQPVKKGNSGVWVIDSVSAKFTKIADADPSKGETFIYGRLLSIDIQNRTIKIQREYQDSPDMNNKVDSDIPVLKDAVIHFQKKIGISDNGYKYEEQDMRFEDMKVGSELGIILTKDKKARAIIVSDPTQIIKEPNIKIVQPKENQVVESPFKVEGTARVFEGTVNIELITSDGKLLDQTTAQATAGAPSWGEFQAMVSYQPLDKPVDGLLRVYSRSPKDGSQQDMVIIPIRLK
ncbi:Sporulation and spore germination [Caldanaerobius fijiensis DSM 17918]|uniref:Sporulation and spore germination n=1 Tax=Caldanaerobius fijiensis DSM 17918 TaxID=1121256 RepID=A0A1M5CWQ2_9THEO|nr:Gmad2 immunoglobulin-like domain-containing protein [Caldanaerobius fijiensis]SHF59173.1 Sporulation and spore germination [Caldanaerobius fijiensis DSM 17918]